MSCICLLPIPSIILNNRKTATELFLLALLIIAVISLLFESYSLVNSKVPETSRENYLNGANDDRQYACVIDAGSSGSRLYIYTWLPHNGVPTDLLRITPLLDSKEKPVVKKIEPGLSSMAGRASEASLYIKPLLDFAAQTIPEHKHHETVLYILATAGMRVLDESEQKAILDNLKENIPKNYSFLFTNNNAEVISGKLEGMYQWTAINYILGRFTHSSDGRNGKLVAVDVPGQTSDPTSPQMLFRKQTTGIIDMGGVSLQVAMEITSRVEVDLLKESAAQSMAEFNLGCRSHETDHLYRLFVTTYLGLGANQARGHYEKMLIQSSSGDVGSLQSPIADPCLPLDRLEIINYTKTNQDSAVSPMPFPVSSEGADVLKAVQSVATPAASIVHNSSNTAEYPPRTRYYFRGTGDFAACENVLPNVLRDIIKCPGEFCTAKQFPHSLLESEFYGVSEFWYSMEDVLLSGGPYEYPAYSKLSKDYCRTRWTSLERRFKKGYYPLSDFTRLRMQCFKSAWVTTILHDWYGFPKNFTNLRSIANTVNNSVVHWTLGALVFRTRYIPLRSLQETDKPIIVHPPSTVLLYLNQYTLFLCFIVVGIAILLYLHRLRCLRFSTSYAPAPFDDHELDVRVVRDPIYPPKYSSNNVLLRNSDKYYYSSLQNNAKDYYRKL